MHVDLVATKNITRKSSFFKMSRRLAFVKKKENNESNENQKEGNDKEKLIRRKVNMTCG